MQYRTREYEIARVKSTIIDLFTNWTLQRLSVWEDGVDRVEVSNNYDRIIRLSNDETLLGTPIFIRKGIATERPLCASHLQTRTSL